MGNRFDKLKSIGGDDKWMQSHSNPQRSKGNMHRHCQICKNHQRQCQTCSSFDGAENALALLHVSSTPNLGGGYYVYVCVWFGTIFMSLIFYYSCFLFFFCLLSFTFHHELLQNHLCLLHSLWIYVLALFLMGWVLLYLFCFCFSISSILIYL